MRKKQVNSAFFISSEYLEWDGCFKDKNILDSLSLKLHQGNLTIAIEA
jgi:hypothetical protein